jgi:NAD(P)-dependent dehydrogenase (short-subunit alcohol dehydrogenase family)
VGISIDLKGRRVLVVGASSGVGRTVSVAVGAGGGRVAAVGRRAELLEEVLAAAGGDGLALPADLREEAECRRVVAEAVDAFGGLDVVLFPIGFSPLGLMVKSDAQTWADAFATNVIAPTLVTAAVVEALGDKPGLFVYVSSATTARPVHGLGAYGASKSALDYSIRNWRLEHPEHRFIRLAIGATMPTDIHRGYDNDVLGECLPKWAASGLVTATFMHVDDVGAAMAEVAALALGHQGISIDDLTFNPASRQLDEAALQARATAAAAGNRGGEVTGAVTV